MSIHLVAGIATALALGATAANTDRGGGGDFTASTSISDYRSGGPVGIGLTVGHRAGLTVQAWPSPNHAFSFDVGATPFVNTFSFAAGWTGRPAHIRAPNGVSAHVYLGVGFRMRVAFSSTLGADGEAVATATPLLGVRVPIGMSLLMKDFPVEFFVEVAPAIDAWSAFGVDVEGIGGVRVYLPGPESRPAAATATDTEPAPPPKTETKKAETKKAETKKAETKKAETKKAETKKADGNLRKPPIPGKPGVPVVGFAVSIDGAEAQTTALRKEAVTIGKSPDAVLTVRDAALADIHCSVQLHGGALVLVDFGNGTGTLLNGAPVSSAPIASGDVIKVGKTTITVTVTPTR